MLKLKEGAIMKVAIMQPYFLPYIGYFQLINAVDLFVICDDVNYIKNGWINRNRILLANKDYKFTVPIEKQSQNKLINELTIYNGNLSKKNLLTSFEYAYKKAPHFKEIHPLLKDIILNEENHLSNYITYSLKKISNFLDLDTKIILSSHINKNINLKKQDKILEMCHILQATDYINAIGGVSLYDKKIFKKNKINLFFLKSNDIQYNQFKSSFIPCLSIIDVLMFNSKTHVQQFLNEYELI